MNILTCSFKCDEIKTRCDLIRRVSAYSANTEADGWGVSQNDPYNADTDRFFCELPDGCLLVEFGAFKDAMQVLPCELIQNKALDHKLEVIETTKCDVDTLSQSDKHAFISRFELYTVKETSTGLKIDLTAGKVEALDTMMPLAFLKYCFKTKLTLKTVQGEPLQSQIKIIDNSEIWDQGSYKPTFVIFGTDSTIDVYGLSQMFTGFADTAVVSNPFDTEHRDTIFTDDFKGIHGFTVKEHGLAAARDRIPVGAEAAIGGRAIKDGEYLLLDSVALFYKKTIYTLRLDSLLSASYLTGCAYCLLSRMHDEHRMWLCDIKEAGTKLKAAGYFGIDFEALKSGYKDKRIKDLLTENEELKSRIAAMSEAEASKTSDDTSEVTTDTADKLAEMQELLNIALDSNEEYKAKIDSLTAKLTAAEQHVSTVTGSYFEQRLAKNNEQAMFRDEAIWVLYQVLTEEQARLAGIPDATRRKAVIADILEDLENYGIPSFPKDLEQELMKLIPKMNGTLSTGDRQQLARLGFVVEANGTSHYKIYLKDWPVFYVTLSGTTKYPMGRATPAKQLLNKLFK